MANRPGDKAEGEPWSNRTDPLDAVEKAQAAETYAKAVGERVDKVWNELLGLRDDFANFRKDMAEYIGGARVKDEHDTRGINAIDARFQGHSDRMEKLDDRVRANERYRWMFPISTLASFMSALAAITVALISIF